MAPPRPPAGLSGSTRGRADEPPMSLFCDGAVIQHLDAPQLGPLGLLSRHWCPQREYSPGGPRASEQGPLTSLSSPASTLGPCQTARISDSETQTQHQLLRPHLSLPTRGAVSSRV